MFQEFGWEPGHSTYTIFVESIDVKELRRSRHDYISYLFLEHEFSFTNASTFYVSAISQNAYFFGTELRSLLEVTLIYQEGHEIGL